MVTGLLSNNDRHTEVPPALAYKQHSAPFCDGIKPMYGGENNERQNLILNFKRNNIESVHESLADSAEALFILDPFIVVL